MLVMNKGVRVIAVANALIEEDRIAIATADGVMEITDEKTIADVFKMLGITMVKQ